MPSLVTEVCDDRGQPVKQNSRRSPGGSLRELLFKGVVLNHLQLCSLHDQELGAAAARGGHAQRVSTRCDPAQWDMMGAIGVEHLL